MVYLEVELEGKAGSLADIAEHYSRRGMAKPKGPWMIRIVSVVYAGGKLQSICRLTRKVGIFPK